FSPDGTRLAVGTYDGVAHGSCRLCDMAEGRPAPTTLRRQAVALAFSPDSSLLAIADRNGAVAVCHLAAQSERVLREPRHHRPWPSPPTARPWPPPRTLTPPCGTWRPALANRCRAAVR